MNKRTQLNFVTFFSKPSQEGGSYEATWRLQPQDKPGVLKAYLEDIFGGWEPEVKELIGVSEFIPAKLLQFEN